MQPTDCFSFRYIPKIITQGCCMTTFSANKNLPSYRKHKASGRAVVTLSGKDHYLGPYGTEASRHEYDRVILEWLANGRKLCPAEHGKKQLSVNELILQYWNHAKDYYVKNGQPTSEQGTIKSALRPLRRLYGDRSTDDFTPLGLKAVRTQYVSEGLCRATVNRYVSHIKRMFKWAVENELVQVEVWQALQAVSGLKKGRSEAEDYDPIRPVREQAIKAVEPYVSRQVWAMIQLQLCSGMRPGEVTIMRTSDLEIQDDVWIYRPTSHKNEHRGQSREVLLGPNAQVIIKQWIQADLSEFLFSPEEAEQERNALRIKIKSRKAKSSNQRGKRFLGKFYTPASYRRAIKRACEIAFGMPDELRNISDAVKDVPEAEKETVRSDLQEQASEWRKQNCWHPNQLRHNAATEYQNRYGWIVAKALCGHSKAETTQIYAEMDRNVLLEAVRKSG